MDIDVFLTASNLNARAEKLRKGEDITDTYDQEQLMEMFNNAKYKRHQGKPTQV